MTMITSSRTRRVALVVLVMSVALGATMLLLARSGGEITEIVVTARDMRFYVTGLDGPNPEITLPAGGRVRLTLRNEDAGITHDIAVPGLGVATELLTGAGETSVVFDVPGEPGAYPYLCTPHARMMSGVVRVP